LYKNKKHIPPKKVGFLFLENYHIYIQICYLYIALILFKTYITPPQKNFNRCRKKSKQIMSNQDLLKQAIAEAKTIREAAIANAKEALEESLTPHLKDMLAAKLQEMEEAEVEEEIVNEEDMINDPKGPTAKGNVAEAEEEEEEEEETEEAEEEESEESEEEELEIEDMSVEDLKNLIRDIVSQEVGNEDESQIEDLPTDDMVGAEEEEEIDINELLGELAEMEEKEKVKEYGRTTMKEPSDAAAEGLKVLGNLAKKAGMSLDKFIEVVGEKLHGGQGFGLNVPGGVGPNLEEDLEEALKTVKKLKGQLQEVNLLNAKLLYVNKVLKVNNLSEGQKVNIITAFDKAETVKEVKLVYETVSKNITNKPASIKEHKSFASKAVGTAKTGGKKEIISEVTEQVARWQKLAGIIK